MDTKRTELERLLQDAHGRSGLTYREVAEICDMDHSYVPLILALKRRPNRDVLIALCAYAYQLTIYETDEILLLADCPPLGREARREYTTRRSRPGEK